MGHGGPAAQQRNSLLSAGAWRRQHRCSRHCAGVCGQGVRESAHRGRAQRLHYAVSASVWRQVGARDEAGWFKGGRQGEAQLGTCIEACVDGEVGGGGCWPGVGSGDRIGEAARQCRVRGGRRRTCGLAWVLLAAPAGCVADKKWKHAVAGGGGRLTWPAAPSWRLPAELAPVLQALAASGAGLRAGLGGAMCATADASCTCCCGARGLPPCRGSSCSPTSRCGATPPAPAVALVGVPLGEGAEGAGALVSSPKASAAPSSAPPCSRSAAATAMQGWGGWGAEMVSASLARTACLAGAEKPSTHSPPMLTGPGRQARATAPAIGHMPASLTVVLQVLPVRDEGGEVTSQQRLLLVKVLGGDCRAGQVVGVG